MTFDKHTNGEMVHAKNLKVFISAFFQGGAEHR